MDRSLARRPIRADCRSLHGEFPSLVIFKSSLYQDCSHSFVDDVFYPPDETLVAINGRNWPVPDLAVFKLKTPLCGTTPVVLSAEPLSPGTTLRTAGYSQGLWDAREVDWTDVRILPSDTNALISLFPDLNSTAGRLRQMVQTEVPIFNLARPIKDGGRFAKEIAAAQFTRRSADKCRFTE
jgi:hypothetical protein